MHGFFEAHKGFLVWTKIYLLETANRRGLSQILMIQIIQKAVVWNTDRTLSNNQLNLSLWLDLTQHKIT